MRKKTLCFIIILLLVTASVFAQENSFPRHAVSLDVGGLFYSQFLYIFEIFDFLGFATAIQYEFQILDNLSAAARIGFSLIIDPGFFLGSSMDNILSVSYEGHVRYYPGDRRRFFVDGMLGYSVITGSDYPTLNYFVFGPRLGWRVDFGRPGGFFIEPSFGYNIPVDLSNNYSFKTGNEEAAFNFFLAGGPKGSVGMGFRF